MEKRGSEINRMPILLLSICFLLGTAAGCVIVARMNATDFLDYIGRYLNADFKSPALSGIIATELIVPICVFVAGFTLFGMIIAPIMILSKSLYLCAVVSALLKIGGARGFYVSLAVLLVPALLTLPLLFMLATRTMTLSVQLIAAASGKKNGLCAAGLLKCFLFCAFAAVLAASYEAFAAPAIIKWLVSIT